MSIDLTVTSTADSHFQPNLAVHRYNALTTCSPLYLYIGENIGENMRVDTHGTYREVNGRP